MLVNIKTRRLCSTCFTTISFFLGSDVPGLFSWLNCERKVGRTEQGRIPSYHVTYFCSSLRFWVIGQLGNWVIG
jgi:hypothetical protein